MRQLVIGAAIVAALMLSVGAAPVMCVGRDCGFAIDDYAYGSNTEDPSVCGNVASSECFDLAASRARSNVSMQCNYSSCNANCGGGEPQRGSIVLGKSDGGPIADYGSYQAGYNWVRVYASAMCICASSFENQPMAVDPFGIEAAPKIKPYTSPVITPVTSFFKRLFRRGGGQ